MQSFLQLFNCTQNTVYLKKDIAEMEELRERTIKMIKGVKQLPSEERLSLGNFSFCFFK